MSDVNPEKWLPVVGYEGLYEVSSTGRVTSAKRVARRERKPDTSKDGYQRVKLWRDGRGVTRTIHSLVIEAFVGPRPPGSEVRHLNGDPADNRIENLAYGSHRENALDITRHGRSRNANKDRCDSGHLFDDANTYVNPKTGQRSCRTCSREWNRTYNTKRASGGQ